MCALPGAHMDTLPHAYRLRDEPGTLVSLLAGPACPGHPLGCIPSDCTCMSQPVQVQAHASGTLWLASECPMAVWVCSRTLGTIRNTHEFSGNFSDSASCSCNVNCKGMSSRVRGPLTSVRVFDGRVRLFTNYGDHPEHS